MTVSLLLYHSRSRQSLRLDIPKSLVLPNSVLKQNQVTLAAQASPNDLMVKAFSVGFTNHVVFPWPKTAELPFCFDSFRLRR